MDNNEKIKRLRESIETDKKKRGELEMRIREKEDKINELTNLEIVNGVKSITLDSGVSVDEFLSALKKGDVTALTKLIQPDVGKEAV